MKMAVVRHTSINCLAISGLALLTLSLAPSPISPDLEEPHLFELPPPEVTGLVAPWSCGEEFTVSLGHHERSHQGPGQWAWDFATPKGTLLRAPAEGTIRMVRDDSLRHGCNPAYAWDANYVVLELGGGYEVLLLHLEAGSALVEPGQRVSVGQPLARVGDSGYVCGTHLHFQVQKSCSSWWCPSVPAAFSEDLRLEPGQVLRRTDCPTS